MSDDKAAPRVYGAPDPENRQPPPPMGMRGEEGAPLSDPPPGQSREASVDGRTIVVEETSGVAAAEATGKIGVDDDGDGSDQPGSG
jgi:hypothetical protein